MAHIPRGTKRKSVAVQERDYEASTRREDKHQHNSGGISKGATSSHELDTSKPSALFEPKQRTWTLSLAVPGSMVGNVSGFEQKNLLAGSIARAAAVFCVDEIIVFDDDPSTIPLYLQRLSKKSKNMTKAELQALVDPSEEGYQHPDQFLYHLLNYMECPPFLRVPLIAHHPNLNKAGILPSTDMPHHLRAHDWCQYREGMVVDASEVEAYYNDRNPTPPTEETFSWVDCGLHHPVKARTPVPAPLKTRVTVKFADSDPPPSWPNLSRGDVQMLQVDIVSPDAPRKQGGLYWGYKVRRAASISAIFENSPFQGGYDLSIGTSERGVPLASLIPNNNDNNNTATAADAAAADAADDADADADAGAADADADAGAAAAAAGGGGGAAAGGAAADADAAAAAGDAAAAAAAADAPPPPPPTSMSTWKSTSPSSPPSTLPSAFHHLLVVVGGREGIEPAVASDPKLRAAGLAKETAHRVFDYWVNLVPGQGSRTIRTEEAAWVAMMGLRSWLDRLGHGGCGP